MEHFLVGLLPLLLFAAIDWYCRDVRLAIVVAILCSGAELWYLYVSTGLIDPVAITALFLFLALGIWSIRVSDRLYFKLQPAILSFIVVAYLSYLELSGQSILTRFEPLIDSMLQSRQNDLPPNVLQYILYSVIAAVFVEGVWIAYAAARCSQGMWLFVNAFGIWIIVSLLAVFHALFLICRMFL